MKSIISTLEHLDWPSATKAAVANSLHECRIPAFRAALADIANLNALDRGPNLTLSIARSFTLETQLDAITLVLSILPTRPTIKLGELGNFETQLWNPNSELLNCLPDIVLVLWRIEDLYPSLVESGMSWSAKEREECLTSILQRLRNLCDGYCKVNRAPLFLSTFPEPTTLALSELHSELNLKSMVYLLNREILKLSSENDQIRIFDFAGWCTREGDQCFDKRMDLFAKQPIANTSLLSFACELARSVRPVFFPAAKVLAVDLDNTLWGGVLEEDGLGELKLGHDYPGNVYRLIQIEIKKCKEQGILLALTSKNNFDAVKDAFDRLPEMLLKLDDFSSVKVNWEPKRKNLCQIAQELNVGLDSFVFVDDNHLEREEIKHFLPQVRVLPVTEEPLSILEALRSRLYFDTYRLNEEDRLRSQFYALKDARYIPTSEAADPLEFLRSLQMRAIVEHVTSQTLPRVLQMIQKTNQFNLTTRRHNEGTIRNWLNNERNILLTISLEDRFGTQGIVGLLIGVADTNASLVKVDTFLLSCRVIGKGVEKALWGAFIELAEERGYKKILSEYVRSAKNDIVSNLFSTLGMATIATSDEVIQYKLALPASCDTVDWIQTKVQRREQSRSLI